MTASACLTLALIHALIWWWRPLAIGNLLFSLAATATALFAAGELGMMRAHSSAEFALIMRWTHVPIWVLFLTLVGFVRFYFRAGSLPLAWLACGLRTMSLVLDFTTGDSLNYRHVRGLNQIQFLGDWISVPQGTANPWMGLGQSSLLLLLLFVMTAAAGAWRHGERRKPITVAGSIVLFIVAASMETMLSVWRPVHWPIINSLFFLGIIAAMSFELSRDTLNAFQLAEELQQSREQATHLLRAATLGELSSAIAHELNQPLMAILSNAQAAQRMLGNGAADPSELRAILTDIVADDQRAGEVIRRLRTLLKKGDFRPQPLNAAQLFGDALAIMNGDLNSRGIAIVTDFTPGPPHIFGDPVQLQQVLINLILNAADAMVAVPAGARRLTLSCSRSDGHAVQLCVADTGGGLPPGGEEKIFEPYHTTKPGGLGLGLSLSRSIAKAHGGNLWAEIRPGGGTVLCFTVPAADELHS